MGAVWRSHTGGHQQRFDVVGVEDSDQVIEWADEPAAAVREHLHQLIDLQETFFCALHLRMLPQRKCRNIQKSCAYIL